MVIKKQYHSIFHWTLRTDWVIQCDYSAMAFTSVSFPRIEKAVAEFGIFFPVFQEQVNIPSSLIESRIFSDSENSIRHLVKKWPQLLVWRVKHSWFTAETFHIHVHPCPLKSVFLLWSHQVESHPGVEYRSAGTRFTFEDALAPGIFTPWIKLRFNHGVNSGSWVHI